MSPLDSFELLLGLLTVAVLLSTLAPFLRLPPAAVFVLGGMALALVPGMPGIALDPDLVLVLFLPPLLMASAYMTVWRDFRDNLGPILVLALGAVVFTTATVGWVAKLLVPELPWAACFTLGAIVSPPDAVAAKAVLARLRLPRRLVTVLEGESLINDASGLVLYRFAAAAALSGIVAPGQMAGSFAWLSVAGIGVGAGIGYVADLGFRRMRDRNHVIITSFLLAYASYIAAERVHASGVLAVVCCGLVMGWRQHATLSAEVRMQAKAVWQVVVFALEALVFVLIGLSLRGVLERLGVNGAALTVGLPLTLGVTAAVVVSRFVLVVPSIYVLRLFPGGRREPAPPLSIPLVLSWAGMRGVVSLAAALALPADFPGRDPILLATFGVILATVLLQGTTLGVLARWLRLDRVEGGTDGALSEEAARAHVMATAADWLESVRDPATGEAAHPFLLRDFRRRAEITARFVNDVERLRPVREAHFGMSLQALAQARRALLKLHRGGTIHDSVLATIEAELDLEELHMQRMGGIATAGH